MKGYLPHYQGNFKNGKKEGLGIYYWNQRQYYSGQFKNNKIHGKGRHVTKELDYKGEFIEGLKDGKGILVNTLKNWKYEGQFKKNKMDGMGTIIWDDKTKFEGEFEENERKKGKLFLCTG